MNEQRATTELVNETIDALNEVQASLSCLSRAARVIKDIQRHFAFAYDKTGVFRGLSPKTFDRRDSPEITYLANHDFAKDVAVSARFVPQWADTLWKARAAAEAAASKLPSDIGELLSRSLGRDWGHTLRLELLDPVLTWPGETMNWRAMGARKVPGNFRTFAEYVVWQDPAGKWEEYGRTIDGFCSQLLALAGSKVLDSSPASTPAEVVLTPKQENILRALIKLAAITGDKRRTARRIAVAVDGAEATENEYKHALRQLVKMDFLHSQRSAGGGYWLTKKGATFLG